MRRETELRLAAAEAALVRSCVALGRALRGAGIRAGVDSAHLFCRALGELSIRDRDEVYWAARATMLRERDQLAAFDAIFERFWEGRELLPTRRGGEHGESDPRMTGPQHGGESMPQFRSGGRASQLVDGGLTQAAREVPSAGGREEGEGMRRGAMAAWSAEDVRLGVKPQPYEPSELRAVRALADELRRSTPQRLSRRSCQARQGRLEVRATLRRSLRTDGEPLRLAFRTRSIRPRKMLLLCDVSGSMDRYSRLMLASLKAAVAANRRAEAFAFATGLTRLTPALAEGDVERSLELARHAVGDWSGGTRIGAALAQLNRDWCPRGVARGAIAIVISDGWDRGDPRLLVRELDRLRLQSRRLVWVNPRPGQVAAQPLAVGLRAALPVIDDYVPGDDERAIAGLGALIRGIDRGRPVRRPASFTLVPEGSALSASERSSR